MEEVEPKEYSIEWYDAHEGDEIEIDDNLCECAHWTIGENRCSCGNVRITLEDFIGDGTYYPSNC